MQLIEFNKIKFMAFFRLVAIRRTLLEWGELVAC